MMIKKSIFALLAIAMLFAVNACSKTANQSQTVATAEQSQNSGDSQTPSTAPSDANQGAVVQAAVGGKLQQLNLKEGEAPIIRGLALDGNRAGKSIEDDKHTVNGRPLADNNIRFVFELNEWISIRLDTDKQSGLSATIAPHVDDPTKFTDSFIDSLTDASPRLELNPPEDSDSAASWGETYLHIDNWKPGDYDLVLLSGKTPIARVLLKFYPERELEGQTDEQLEKLMQNP